MPASINAIETEIPILPCQATTRPSQKQQKPPQNNNNAICQARNTSPNSKPQYLVEKRRHHRPYHQPPATGHRDHHPINAIARFNNTIFTHVIHPLLPQIWALRLIATYLSLPMDKPRAYSLESFQLSECQSVNSQFVVYYLCTPNQIRIRLSLFETSTIGAGRTGSRSQGRQGCGAGTHFTLAVADM